MSLRCHDEPARLGWSEARTLTFDNAGHYMGVPSCPLRLEELP
jgi:hypothetical protein